MALNTQDRILIETRIANEGPNVGVAYLLWIFLGLFSAHRFYLGRPGSAVLQIISFFIVLGFLWLLVDLFLIPGMARDKRERLREKLTVQALALSEG